jgi:integrase
MLFVRPGELRHAGWAEIDFEKAEWRIAAGKMKMKSMHIVPLCTRALEILRELEPHIGQGRYVFPGVRAHSRPMSENTINTALRRLGYEKDEMTGHGGLGAWHRRSCTSRDGLMRRLRGSELMRKETR